MKTIIVIISIVLLSMTNSIGQWTRINAVPSRDIVSMAVIRNTILAATNSNILYKSADAGITWDSIRVSTNPIVPIVLKVIDDKIYIGTSNFGIFSSADFGLTWQNSGRNLFAVSGIEKFGNNLYAATLGNGIFVFDAGTNNWLPFNNLLPSYSVNVFSIVSTSNSLIVSAGSNGTFYRYDFSSNSWVEEYFDGVLHPGLQIQKMIYDSGTIYAVNGNRIMKSVDDGLTWASDKVGSHNGYARTIISGAENNFTTTNVVSGGTWIQHRNKNASTGTSWSVKEEFLQNGFTYDILEFKNKLFLARADGIYVTNITLGITSPKIGLLNIELFPNPSNGKEINISCDEKINKVSITNSFGKIMYSETIDENKFAIQTNLTTGIYFISLILMNRENVVKRLVVN